MQYKPEIHHRRSIRLKGYDYSQEGMYFITICVQDCECLFGKIVQQIMILNDAGKIAEQCWLSIPEHFPNTILHEYIVMPNHIHGIIEISGNVGANHHSPDNDIDVTDVGANHHSPVNEMDKMEIVGAKNFSPLPPQPFRSPSRTIGSIIRGFKIGVTKWFDQSVWQRDYYDYIIRSTEEYECKVNYIINNPMKWREVKFFK